MPDGQLLYPVLFREKPLTPFLVERICARFPQIDAQWLLTAASAARWNPTRYKTPARELPRAEADDFRPEAQIRVQSSSAPNGNAEPDPAKGGEYSRAAEFSRNKAQNPPEKIRS